MCLTDAYKTETNEIIFFKSTFQLRSPIQDVELGNAAMLRFKWDEDPIMYKISWVWGL